MRFLVDTSVWSLAFRRDEPADHPAVAKLCEIIDGKDDVFLIGVVLQEVLQAFRSEATVSRVERQLSQIPLLDLSRQDYALAAGIRRRCASSGVTVHTVDCQIAAAAIAHRCALLTTDRDFDLIAARTGLQLA